MDASVPGETLEFHGWRFDARGGHLLRKGPHAAWVQVPVGARAREVLAILLQQPGALVSKDDSGMLSWPNIVVEPNNLTVQIAALRRVLDRDRLSGSCIETVSGRGYRFVAAVKRLDEAEVDGPGTEGYAPDALVPNAGIATTPRLSLVVLPFDYLGSDPNEDYLAEAITEDLTTDLSRLPGLLVTARSSAATYNGQPVDVRQVGKELGVGYAVEGSVRKVDGILRVNAQLVSTETGMHLAAERFDVRRDGIGYGVDDIVRLIAWTLSVRIVDAEAERNLRERPSNPDVADILLRARSIYSRPRTAQRQAELVPLYERALELDPNSATALASLAEAELDNRPFSADDPSTPEKIRRAEELLKRAALLRPDDGKVMWVRVYLLGAQNRYPEVLAAAQRAIEANPMLAGVLQWRGICLTRMGRPAEAIPELEQAIRINPRTPEMAARCRHMGYPLLFLGRYDEAVTWFQRSLAANPDEPAEDRSDSYAAIAAAWPSRATSRPRA